MLAYIPAPWILWVLFCEKYLQINQVQGHTMHVKNLHCILGPSYVSGIGRHLPHPQRDHRQRDPLDLEAKQKYGRTTVQLGEFR